MFFRMLPYIRHSLIRGYGRSLLIILGVAVAVYVIVSLQITIRNLDRSHGDDEAERILNVREAARSNVLASRLPENFEHLIADVPGVQAATGVLYQMTNLGGKRKMHVFMRGVDAQNYAGVHHFPVDPAQWQLFTETSNGAIVGSALMGHMEWQVGDTVEIPAFKMNLQVVGVVPTECMELQKQILVHRHQLQIARDSKGRISFVLVFPKENSDPLQLARQIDATMQATPVPTETVSAAAFAEATVKSYKGFVNYLKMIRWIVIGITILGATNAIGISIRQRTREFGILKAIGLFPWLICLLVITEAMLLSIIGGLLGMAAAALFSRGAIAVSASVAVFTIGVSAFIGILGGLAPALTASKLRIVEALNTID